MIDQTEPSARVDHDSDCVDANGLSPAKRAASISEPCRRETTQARALRRIESQQWLLVGADRSLAGADPSRLDLDEDERALAADDQIDLPVTRAHVAREHDVADLPQMSRCKLLATPAKRSPRLVGCSRAGARRTV